MVKSGLIDLKLVAQKLLDAAGDKRVLLFNGSMGSGKTTLIKEVCNCLGVIDHVSSPTFGIVNEYKSKSGTVYHFDAYRIENEDEAYDFGIEEYLDSGNWCLIEWPDKIKNVLPLENELFSIDIQLDNESRSYEF
jgi:tRNA threonylcarbamoyladenosine biosynthesis protein TsaE